MGRNPGGVTFNQMINRVINVQDMSFVTPESIQNAIEEIAHHWEYDGASRKIVFDAEEAVAELGGLPSRGQLLTTLDVLLQTLNAGFAIRPGCTLHLTLKMIVEASNPPQQEDANAVPEVPAP